MNNGISRRDLALLGGASLVVSACGSATDGATSGPVGSDASINLKVGDEALAELFKKRFSTNALSGEFPVFGKDPHQPPPFGSSNPIHSNYVSEFAPKFIHIIQIKMSNDWELKVNQAHFSISGDLIINPKSRIARVVDIINEKKSPLLGENDRFSQNSKNKPHIKNNSSPRKDYAEYFSLDKLGYGQQSELFIYYDSERVSLFGKYLISFNPTSLMSPNEGKNFSFFNARIGEPRETENLRKGRIVRVENWYTSDEMGSPIPPYPSSATPPPADIPYAMNFHFGVPVKGGGNVVPMIIDPNTGNGAGNEP